MTLHHYESLDRSDYPDGRYGKQLPTEFRVLEAVDLLEAMSTRRLYRKARTREETLEELKGGKDSKYDGDVVEILVEIIEEEEMQFGGE